MGARKLAAINIMPISSENGKTEDLTLMVDDEVVIYHARIMGEIPYIMRWLTLTLTQGTN